MLSCKNIAEHAGDIHDKQLPLPKRMGVWLHLMMCKACRRFIRQYEVAATTAAKAAEEKVEKAKLNEISRKARE